MIVNDSVMKKMKIRFSETQLQFSLGILLFIFNAKRLGECIDIGALGVNLGSVYLWKCFLVSLSVYSAILILAALSAYCLKFLSSAFIFIAGLFFLFFCVEVVLNTGCETFPRDILTLILCLIVPILFINRKKLPRVRYKLRLFDVLIVAWAILTMLAYLKYNFVLSRPLLIDEKGLWFTLARRLTESRLPLLYERGLPAGIPFISALPNILLRTHFEGSLFFMPIVLIMALTIFLNFLKKDGWSFVFFLYAIVFTINRHAWLRQLTFGSIYGEGLSAVFFLLVTYELFKRRNGNVTFTQVLVLSFSTGMLALAKLPASAVFFSFFPLLLMLRRLNAREKIMVATVFVLPILSWNPISPLARHYASSFFAFDFKLILPIFAYLIKNYQWAVIFAILSLLLIFITFRKKEFLYITPIFFLVLFEFYGYSTIFANADYESIARYLMHGMLALYYLGAIGFSRLVNKIWNGRNRPLLDAP